MRLFGTLLFLLCAAQPAYSDLCSSALNWEQLEGSPNVFAATTRERDALWRSGSTLLGEYETAVRAKLPADFDLSPLALLSRQRSLYRSYPLEVRVFDLILEGKLGEIKPISCLEAQAFRKHLDVIRWSLSPWEFEAHILVEPGTDTVTVVLQSTETPYVVRTRAVRRFLERRRARGWQYWASLHRHPFFLDPGAPDVAGTLIPSGGDRGMLKKRASEEQLQEGWITNGLDTIHISAEEFALFSEEQ